MRSHLACRFIWAVSGAAIVSLALAGVVVTCGPSKGPTPAPDPARDAAPPGGDEGAPHGKPAPPFDVSIEAPARGAIGEHVDLAVIATALRPLESASVEVVFPSEMSLLAGESSWTGPVEEGETLRFEITARIDGAGTYSVFAFLRSEGMARRAELNVIADERGVDLSPLPIELMRYRRATSDEERARSLGTPGVKPEKPRSSTEDRDGEERAELGGGGITVHGKIVYADSAGTEHPVRFAQVQILQRPGAAPDCDSGHGPAADGLLATTQTKIDGTYTATVTPGPDPDSSAPDIMVRVLSRLTKPGDPTRQVVAFVEHFDAADLFYCESPLSVDVAVADLTIDFSVGAAVSGSTTDPTSARVFSVLDSMMVWAAGARYMRGGALLPALKVRFPATGTVSSYDPTGVALKVLRADALDWDVLGHEFGHYLTARGTTKTIDSNPGGRHSGCSAIGENDGTGHLRTKDEGMRLAWSEGQATFYAIAFQFVPGVALPGIPNTGDTNYQDTEDATLTIGLEGTAGCSEGYASEISVQRVLWDIHDSAIDSDAADATITDKVNVDLRSIWRLITAADNNTLPKFYSSVASRPGVTLRTLVQLGNILTLNFVAARLGAPADSAILSSVVSPTFMWTPQGDPAATYRNDRFTLVVSKDNFATRSTWDAGTATSFTVPEADWKALFASGVDETTVFRWIVLSHNSAAPESPTGGLLDGNWASHSHRFTPKAFEIRLTWPTVGADVDLHLRPPDGAGYVGWDYSGDCAYYNLSPDWGVVGDPSDNPTLDIDCITTCAEENITLDKVTTPGTYKVIVHYYSDHGLGATTATVQVLRFGRKVRESSMVVTNPGDPDSGTVWEVFRFDI